MLPLRNASAIRREIGAAQRIPYSAHVAPSVVSTVFGDYVQVFRLIDDVAPFRAAMQARRAPRHGAHCGSRSRLQ